MISKRIDKRSDPLVKRLREVRDGKDKTFLFCEGRKVVEELFKSNLQVTEVFSTQTEEPYARKLAKQKALPLQLLSDDVMSFVSDLENPQGIAALAKRPTRVD